MLCLGWGVTLRREAASRKAVEKALCGVETRSREMLENIKLIAVIVDTDGNITFCNDFFLNVVGWRREEILGANWFDSFIPPNQGTVKRLFDSFRAEGAFPVHLQNDIVTRDGKSRFISWNNTVLRDWSGQISGIMGIGEDITDRINAENALSFYREQLEKLAAELSLAEERERRRLAADLHDRIGQSLAFANIKTHTLREFVADGGRRHLADLMGLMEQVIQDVRTLIFQISPPILYELGLEAALEWLAESTQQERGFPVIFSDGGESKPLADEMKVTLFQVVRELLINAAKHARPAQVAIDVRRRGNRIVLMVKDDGVGFDISSVSINPRAHPGFGLFNIRQRMETLGGDVAIDSLPGRGTTVTVSAPLAHGRHDSI
nr:PAS domain-containing sensor histidine kinase [Geobacter grbiciae]